MKNTAAWPVLLLRPRNGQQIYPRGRRARRLDDPTEWNACHRVASIPRLAQPSTPGCDVLPGTDLGNDEKAVGRPRVRSEALDNFGCAGSKENEERIARALQRSNKGSESLLEHGVHEGSMGGPFRLSLQRLRVIPRRSTRPQDNECAFHSTTELSFSSSYSLARRSNVSRLPCCRHIPPPNGVSRVKGQR